MHKEESSLVSPYFLDRNLPQLKQIEINYELNEPIDLNGTQFDKMSGIHHGIKSFVVKTILLNKIPVSICGDCCASIPVLAGIQEAGIDPILIWLDAHGDFNTFETTISGHPGGMPLAMISGRGDLSLLNAVDCKPMKDEDIVLSDARDLDPKEKLLLKESFLLVINDINDLKKIIHHNRPIYLHFDTDLVRLEDIPAQNYPAKGGPSLEDMKDLFSWMKSNLNICAISMSTWNPELDGDGKSMRNSMELLKIFTE